MVTRKLCVVKWGTVRNRCVYIIFAMCNPTVLNLYALHGLVYKVKKTRQEVVTEEEKILAASTKVQQDHSCY